MKIIIDTENEKKNKKEKERDEALWKQEQEERLAIACEANRREKWTKIH